MTGRPKGSVTIVPPHEVLDHAAILQENWCMERLCDELSTTEKCIKWLARHRLLNNSYRCMHCDYECALSNYSHCADGKVWHCTPCKTSKRVRDKCFFSGSRLTLKQIVLFIYCWARQMPLYLCAHEAQIGEWHTVTEWAKFCRQECQLYLERHASPLGGLDDNGNPILVEIYQSQYFNSRDNKKSDEERWVFCGVERRNGNCFLVEVPDRKITTLEALIKEYILPGSHIVSEEWAACVDIARLYNGVYIQSVVNNIEEFVDPFNNNASTQGKEYDWLRSRRKFINQCGTKRQFSESYLHEFLYRNNFQKKKAFENFLVTLSENYNI